MTSWMHRLGEHLLNHGALSYIVCDDDPASWSKRHEQQIDMVVFYQENIHIIELKHTASYRRKMININQIMRYQTLCEDTLYPIQFWVYVYWETYGIVTGVKMDVMENLNFFAIDTSGTLEFYVSIGSDPLTRVRKPVDMKWRMVHE